ncbi:nitroreductase family protein [Kutzneria albida]|uniref:Nitroreductase domain-containing protein n=1 Tax=Kutzneria albida DSM 43870 TaxID=1449976 RepID=W5WIE9_9PSEU|nr:nitroreductase family protein [Kutzneria albida]AHI00526.1 hypothetical protein KALB_7168 [Kutzneria albida DSM 43870]
MNAYEEFWAASRLTRLTQRRLVEQLAEYRPRPALVDRLSVGGAPLRLPQSRDWLRRLHLRRRSEQGFGARPMSARDLGAVLGVLAAGPDGRRGYPSAGGLYPVRCYPLLLNVAHPLAGRVTRYEPVAHAVQDVAPCPSWTELAALLGAVPGEQAPGAVLAFVLDDADLLAKYGVRGGRFGLVEVGAAAQSVGLRLASRGLAGCLLGGAADAELLALLGLSGRQLRVGGVLVCGRASRGSGAATRTS